MGNEKGRNGCDISYWYPPVGTLPRLFSLLFCLIVPVLPIRCIFKDTALEKEKAGIEERDSTVRLNFRIADACKTIDIFIYEGTGLKRLEKHLNFAGTDTSQQTQLLPGDKIIMAVSNVKGNFNKEGVSSAEALEQLVYRLQDDDAEKPLQTATMEINVSKDTTCAMKLQALICKVRVIEVTNSYGYYSRLENPSIHLENASLVAEPFREKGFYPALTGTTPAVGLPYDIGILPQRPGIYASCYPDESGKTQLVFECTIEGRQCRYSVTLPPFGKGAELHVGLDIFSEDDFRSEVSGSNLRQKESAPCAEESGGEIRTPEWWNATHASAARLPFCCSRCPSDVRPLPYRQR